MSDAVLFSTLDCRHDCRIGLVTLNAPVSLNALSHAMNEALARQLRIWAAMPEIALVVLRGAGEKAFCAGGDVKALHHALIQQTPPSPAFPAQYFSTEYRLDLRIHQYPKPILAWGNGIVMGGGMGLMQGARRRVVTESSRLAMPEVLIGLTPDVGGSWFLSRLPGRLGLFLALTGVSVNAHDALHLGLADRALPQKSFDALLEYLYAQPWRRMADNIGLLDRALTAFAVQHSLALPASPVAQHALRLQALMQCGDLHEVVTAIEALRDDSDPWLQQAAKQMAQASPTAVAVCWEIHHRLRQASLAEVFRSELNLAVNFCLQHDFREGVRARLIDKDQAPRWQPAALKDVTPEWVEAHFKNPWPEDEHPLLKANVSQPGTGGLQAFEAMFREESSGT